MFLRPFWPWRCITQGKFLLFRTRIMIWITCMTTSWWILRKKLSRNPKSWNTAIMWLGPDNYCFGGPFWPWRCIFQGTFLFFRNKILIWIICMTISWWVLRKKLSRTPKSWKSAIMRTPNHEIQLSCCLVQIIILEALEAMEMHNPRNIFTF